jgi:hypothetical protein
MGRGKTGTDTSSTPTPKPDHATLLSMVKELMAQNRELQTMLEGEREKRHELEVRVVKLEGWSEVQEERSRNQYWKVIDLTARSMRNNIVIQGPGMAQRAPDKAWEKWSETESHVRSALAELGVDAGVAIERAHRLGGYRAGRQRPIVVMFSRWPDKAAVMDLRGRAKALSIWLNEQLPSEILDKRRRLRVAAEAKFGVLGDGRNGTTKVIHNFDKIKVDGVTYDLRTDDSGDSLVVFGRPGGERPGRRDGERQLHGDRTQSRQRQSGHQQLKRPAPAGGDVLSPGAAVGGGKRPTLELDAGAVGTQATAPVVPGAMGHPIDGSV